ncbi:MAG: nucleoside-diphosphate kinase [Candidatus Odinarchaeia archaeon]
MIERSLVILKPDAYLRKYVGAMVLDEFINEESLEIIGFKKVKPSIELAKKHYAVHKDKPFFNKLIEYLTLSDVIVLIIEGENAIEKIRKMLGKTFSQDAEPDSIRGRFGIWDGINVVHASDAIKTAEYEINLWKNEAGIEIKPSSDIREAIISYISKWSKKKVDYTHQLRKICHEATSKNNIDLNEYGNKLFKYLKLECYDSEEETLKKFVKVILDSLE